MAHYRTKRKKSKTSSMFDLQNNHKIKIEKSQNGTNRLIVSLDGKKLDTIGSVILEGEGTEFRGRSRVVEPPKLTITLTNFSLE